MSLSSALGLAGNYFFGPVGGFIGSTLGKLLDRPEDIVNYGPRIEDRKIQTTGYGQARPIVYGTMQAAGHIIEPKDFALTETVHESEEGGGKGGPTVTNVSYTYSATFAVLLCEGPIVGVRKIWLDSELVYDFSSSTTAEGIIGSNRRAEGIRIYSGSETQTVDSILEAINGAGNTPAYRGSAYLVFDTLQLEKFGNRLPNVRAEIVGSGSSSVAWALSSHVNHPIPYEYMVFTNYDNGVFRIWDRVESPAGKVHLIDANGNYLGSEAIAIKAERVVSQDRFPTDRTNPTYEMGTLGSGSNTYFVHMHNPGDLPSPAGPFYLKALYFDNALGDVIIKDFSTELPQDRYVLGVSISADHKRMLVIMGEIGVSPYTDNDTGLWFMFDENTDLVDSGTCDYYGDGPAGDPITGGWWPMSAYGLGWGNVASFHFAFTMMESDYTHIWSAYSAGSRHLQYWEIDPVTKIFSLTYHRGGSIGSIDAFNRGTIYADNGVCAVAGDYDLDNTKGYFATFSREQIYTTTTALLADIVDDIEERTGVVSGNRNNTALTDAVDGYMIARLMQARKAIEPLQTAFFFDTIETGYKLKSVKRGGSSVATIPITEMGAREYGSEAVYPLSKTRLQETELPIEVVCQYISANRGYEVGVQRSRRIETQSVEKKNIDLPISMSDNKGKQIVEVLHFNFWAERNLYTFTLMPKYTYLDPSDVITVTDSGDVHTIRISSINLTPGGVIQCEGVADRPALYVSTSDGVDNDADAVTVTEIGPTKAVYGDWPMFTNGQNDQALYIAAAGLLSGWRGGVIYRSLDNGASYLQTATAIVAATIGYTTDALSDGNFSTFDYASTVNVNLLSGTLSSTTKLAVLNGANAIMIGTELVQFITATLESDGTYTLSNLLRGRKGTEWAMASHVVGEDAVLIDTTLLRPLATLNIQRPYKAISIGNFLSDTAPVDVTYTGVNLKPFAPVHIKGDRVTGDDLTITWIRRSRFENPPLWTPVVGEDTEEYEIDIYDATWTNILRTITGLTSPTYLYTAAMQVTDFGAAEATVNMKIYQKSATIGRGYEGSAIL